MDIVLGNYKGLKANIPYIAYTEEDVNSQIATLLSGNPVREQKTGPLAMGDTAVIDYEGFKDGVAFEGGKAEKYPLGIGSGSFIPGFEEQLVGMEIGEDRDINLSFPEQYHAPELAGKAVVFKVKLHEIYNEKDFKGLCFVNLVDFDALWGHRRNVTGYGEEIEKFDKNLGILMEKLRDDDLLILTADHGNDPTYKGTDHTREYVPFIAYSKSMKGGGAIEEEATFAVIGATITDNFGVKMPEGTIGTSILESWK